MNVIAGRHVKSATFYPGQPADLITDLEKVFQKKTYQAFQWVDADNNGFIDKEEFFKLLTVVEADKGVSDTAKARVFEYIDDDGSGLIEYDELEKFIKIRFPPKDVIRCKFSLNIDHPEHLMLYHIWKVWTRPLTFSLIPGANMLSAYFEESYDFKMRRSIKKGSQLVYINKTRVTRMKFLDIQRKLNSTVCPFVLIFENTESVRQSRMHENLSSLDKVSCRVRSKLVSGWDWKMFDRPEMDWTNPAGAMKASMQEIYNYHDHCNYCPPRGVWYLKVHLFMEDENYSSMSIILTYTILFLIALSTTAYVLQTLPMWESWVGWSITEALVSVIFTVEFLVRVAACRNVLSYMKGFMNIVDFCAVAPLFIEFMTRGWLNAHLLRIVRAARLIRLIRVTERGALTDTLNVYKHTLKNARYWLLMYVMLAFMILICLSSIVYLIEEGLNSIKTNCDDLSYQSFCPDNWHNFSESSTISFQNSTDKCEIWCQDLANVGCCSFIQMTGRCEFYNIKAFQNELVDSIVWQSGLCSYQEVILRADDAPSPFISLPITMWWGWVTMTLVGYGELYTISESGRLIAALAAIISMVTFSFAIIVVGYHLHVARINLMYEKLPKLVDGKAERSKRGSVFKLLEEVNHQVDMNLFQRADGMVLMNRDNQLNSRYKLEQILCYFHGWSYLSFAWDHTPGLPRVSQFKLFVLFSLYGDKVRKIRRAQKRRDNRYAKQLTSFLKSRLSIDQTLKTPELSTIERSSNSGLRVKRRTYSHDSCSSKSSSVALIQDSFLDAKAGLSPKSIKICDCIKPFNPLKTKHILPLPVPIADSIPSKSSNVVEDSSKQSTCKVGKKLFHRSSEHYLRFC